MASLRVFVLLEHGRGLAGWQQRYKDKLAYDPTPYDYGSAESPQCQVHFGDDGPASGPYATARRILFRLAGVDVVHVLHNLRDARKADVIWTHTEVVHIVLGALKGLRVPLPPVIAQSVWVVDRWPTTNRARRLFYRWAMRHTELATTLSPVNAALLSRMLDKEVRFLPYGVVTEPWVDVAAEPHDGGPLRVLSLGNDQHRDYEALREVARAAGTELEVRLLTRRLEADFAEGIPGLEVRHARSVTESGESFAWADVVALPLHANLHASGITVMLEAAAWSVPVVVTDTGGLNAYFSSDEVSYVPVDCTPEGWIDAIRALKPGDDSQRMVSAMRARVAKDGYSGSAFAAAHVAMSRELLRTK